MCNGEATNLNLVEAMFYVISNRSRSIGQFNELVSYIQSNLSRLKCDTVMFSLLGELSDDIIDSKYKRLKDRIKKVSVTSAASVTIFHAWPNVLISCKEILLYHNTFGFGQQSVKEI